MAFGQALAAALTVYGARKKKQDEDKANAQERADKQSQLAVENKRADQRQQWDEDWDKTQLGDRRTADGRDPTTGAWLPPAQLPSTLTQGPKNSATAPLQTQLGHLQAAASWIRQNAPPTPQNKAMADEYDRRASLVAAQIKVQEEAAARAAQAAAAARAREQQLREEHGYRMQEKGTVSADEIYRVAHREPRVGRGRGDPSAKDADTDAIKYAEEQIAKSPNPRATTERLKAAAIAHNASPRTIEAIDAVGSYYDNKKFPQQPRTQGGGFGGGP